MSKSTTPWSPYNTIFQSKKFGGVLYNSLTNMMIGLNEELYTIAESLRQGEQQDLGEKGKSFVHYLEINNFLRSPEDELIELMKLRHKRNVSCFGSGCLNLVICPTLSCPFNCPYCFQDTQDDSTRMGADTIDAIVSFVEQQRTKGLEVCWYGGEPTLAFDVIRKLTDRFVETFPGYGGASLVTNGYLLDKKKIAQLIGLRITSVQITIDGSETIHNSRRKMKNGEDTYARILKNIGLLMNSSWDGRCSVRVNLDKTNQKEYLPLREELISRFPGKNFKVYPGQVDATLNEGYDNKCEFCTKEWSQFKLETFRENGVSPDNFYPVSGSINVCTATSQNGYVIGPRGELYKCWEDVGKEEMVVGSVHDSQTITNHELNALYMVGLDPFNDKECLQCSAFPICGGGCASKRLRVQCLGDEQVNYCSRYKDSLIDWLEAYLESKEVVKTP